MYVLKEINENSFKKNKQKMVYFSQCKKEKEEQKRQEEKKNYLYLCFLKLEGSFGEKCGFNVVFDNYNVGFRLFCLDMRVYRGSGIR